MDLGTIMTGLAAGITYSLTTFAKKKDQEFDWNKFGTTIVLGAAAGVGMSLLNQPIDTTYAYLINLGAVPVIENALKIVYRKIWPKIQKWID